MKIYLKKKTDLKKIVSNNRIIYYKIQNSNIVNHKKIKKNPIVNLCRLKSVLISLGELKTTLIFVVLSSKRIVKKYCQMMIGTIKYK